MAAAGNCMDELTRCLAESLIIRGSYEMNRISTVDLIRNFSVHGDETMSKPVIVTQE